MDFLQKRDDKYCICDEADAKYAIVPIEEYHGLLNALRIVRERAIQQIDKSVADDHGYRLLRAKKNKKDGWTIKKSTPYSAKIPSKQAKSMIERDLADFYNYEPRVNGFGFISVDDSIVNSIRDKGPGLPGSKVRQVYDFSVDRGYLNDDGIVCISYKIDEVSTNVASGVYEVTYQATCVI